MIGNDVPQIVNDSSNLLGAQVKNSDIILILLLLSHSTTGPSASYAGGTFKIYP